MKAMTITTLALIATASIAASIAPTAIAQADPTPPPCSSGQVQVSNGRLQSASGHRGVTLIFSLASGAGPCTLTATRESTPAPVVR
jgi:hypothetical protein